MAHPDRPGPLLYLKSDGCPDELSVTLTLHKLWLSTPHSGEALVQPLLPVPLSFSHLCSFLPCQLYPCVSMVFGFPVVLRKVIPTPKIIKIVSDVLL